MMFKLAAALALLLTAASFNNTLLAQTGDGWQQVRALQRGREVVVETKTGVRVTGDLTAVSDSAIVVRDHGRDQSIARGEVFRIDRRLAPRHRLLYTGLGLGTGLVVGLAGAVGIFVRSDTLWRDNRAADAAIGASLIGGPVGGALLGRHLAGKGEFELIYTGQ